MITYMSIERNEVAFKYHVQTDSTPLTTSSSPTSALFRSKAVSGFLERIKSLKLYDKVNDSLNVCWAIEFLYIY